MQCSAYCPVQILDFLSHKHSHMITHSFRNSKSLLGFDHFLTCFALDYFLSLSGWFYNFHSFLWELLYRLIMKCNIKIHKFISEQKQGNNILKVSYLFKPIITDEKTTLCDWAKFSLWPLHDTSDTHTEVHSPFSPHIPINQQEIHIEASVINCNMSKLAEQIKTKLHCWTQI